jgi:peptide/nickel transport system permease protein
MSHYLVRRLLLNLLVIWLVTSFVFVAMRILPGDYAAQQVANQFLAGGMSGATPEQQLQEARRRLGTDEPVWAQYGHYMASILRGDFGTSFATGERSIDIVRRALPYSIQLGAMSFAIALLLSFPLGSISAMKQDSLADEGLRLFSTLGLSAPSFFTATIATLLVSRFGLWQLDITGHPGVWQDIGGSVKLFIIPAVASGLVTGAVLTRYLRSQLLDVLRQDYVRTARAKGLNDRVVVTRHVIRNGMIPVVTIMGFQIAALFSGNVILEQMFNIPGMGQRLYQSILARDLPVAQTMTLFIATCLVFINLAVDLIYPILDPRVTVK